MGQVVSQRELISRRGEWEKTGEGVVCAYGAFDLLHPGHIRLFEQARDFGNILTVAVESDELVRRSTLHSGDDAVAMVNAAVERPITPAAERAEIVAALSAVDFAAVIEAPLDKFLQSFRPEVFVCGDDEAEFFDVNSIDTLKSTLDEIGCRLVRLPIEPGYSTDRLIKRISGNRA